VRHRIRSKGGAGGGDIIIIPPGVGGFTDDFSLKIGAADSNAAPEDAASFAFTFPESTDTPLDAITIALQLAESNAVPTDVDTYQLALALAEDNATQADVDTYILNLLQTDVNADHAETVGLTFPAGSFPESSAAPTEASSFTMRVWLSASAGSGVTNPANADGQNNATNAVISTAALGASTETLTSSLGANVPGGVSVASAIYRGWFALTVTLPTSTGRIVARSTSALFADVTMFTATASTSHVNGTFTFDLIAAGIDTLAKLQSLQILHSTTDAVAGVTPAVLNVDAGCVELAAAFS